MIEQEYINKEHYFSARYQLRLVDIIKGRIFGEMDHRLEEIKREILNLIDHTNINIQDSEQKCDILETVVTELSALNSSNYAAVQ